MRLFSFAKISTFLWWKSWAYSVFLFPFFICFYKWPSGRGEVSNCLHTVQSYMEVLQINKQFVLLAAKRKEQNKLSSTLLPERQKVKGCGLWHFKVGSGQRTESECLLQLPARGGRWIQSWREAEESCLIQPETSLGWTCVRTHNAAQAPALLLEPWATHCRGQIVPPTPPGGPAPHSVSTASALSGASQGQQIGKKADGGSKIPA